MSQIERGEFNRLENRVVVLEVEHDDFKEYSEKTADRIEKRIDRFEEKIDKKFSDLANTIQAFSMSAGRNGGWSKKKLATITGIVSAVVVGIGLGLQALGVL